MIEPEITFADLNATMALAESLIKSVINYVLKENKKELEYLEKSRKMEVIKRLEVVSRNAFKRAGYKDCIEILKVNKKEFVHGDID